ncbi:Nucleotide-binding universal stress protein, UspA family [Sinomicrobium oceani]|uniref:Nucleotide-binding universal stress protein, UspA family n=1 Tax=Sinomicrobium oceani TaxID=1150368 RepID=A0A1K1R1A0_9FLAO|nr:universal stress protein [Sinomicrobium oceani]SFW65635.1 Nucleotide-binding universal stress protein, UspA family [Sinomicrobium oceani]
MKRILVPTDFSDEAEFALQTAANFARKFGSEIYLLHVLDLPVHLATSETSELPEALFFVKLARQKFESFTDKPYLKGIRVFDIVESDTIASGITKSVTDNNIDLIIMGSGGATGFKEVFIGSNTEKVVRMAQVPVFTVKSLFEIRDEESMIFASDFSRESVEPYKRASEFAKKTGATLHLLFVNTPNNFVTTREAEERMNFFIKNGTPKKYSLNIYNDHTIEQGIIHFANIVNARMIGLSTHGRTGLSHFFNGSISEDIVNHAMRPVITFKIPDQTEG